MAKSRILAIVVLLVGMVSSVFALDLGGFILKSFKSIQREDVQN